MGARERLEGKERRTATFPVALRDPSSAENELEAAATFLKAAKARDLQAKLDAPSEATQREQVAYDGALARVQDCYEDIEFLALEPDEFEALIGKHVDTDGDLEPDTFRPVLAAASAADLELQDPSWWAEQLSSERWASGEREALYALLWRLNYSPPRGRLGKG